MATAHHIHDHDSGEGLVSVEEARERLLAAIAPLQPLELPLTEAFGCVLARDAVAERDIPDFASSAMDGFAVRSSEVAPASPMEPARRPLYSAPCAWHASSITNNRWRRAMAMMGSMSAICPNK